MTKTARSAASRVAIIDYADAHQSAFQALNEAWLRKYFVVEPIDVEVLGNPRKHILDKGGIILLAEVDGTIVGTVTLIPDHAGNWELSKMSVDPTYQGYGIGKALMRAVIDKAKQKGLMQLYILTNSVLATALHIYRSHGFVDVEPSAEDRAHYDRCDTKLVLDLTV